MKYMILAGTNTFKKLAAIQKRIEEADAIVKALVVELGAEEWLANGFGIIAGELTGVRFAQKPSGWRKVVNRHNDFYFPKGSVKENKTLLDRIDAIPKVKTCELNDCVAFVPQRVGLTRYGGIGVKWGNEFHLVSVAEEVDYFPLSDMVEVTVSEYKRLERQLEEERKEVENA